MGGRPPVAWLIAGVVTAALACHVAPPPAAAQMVIPLPGADKPKGTQKKHPFRPTMPQRNPDRVSAGLSAAVAPSDTAKASVEAAVAAGSLAPASAEGQVRATVTKDVAAADTAAPEADSDKMADASPNDETAQDNADSSTPEVASDTASEEEAPEVIAVAAADSEANAPSAAEDADTPSGDDETAEETPAASSGDETDAATDASAETADAAPAAETSDDSAAETTATDDTAETSTDAAEPDSKTAETGDEPAETSTDDTADDATAKAAEADDADTKDTETTNAEAQDADTPEPVQAAAVESGSAEANARAAIVPDEAKPAPAPETVKAVPEPIHDASVVLQVAPPPDSIPASDEPAKIEPVKDEASEPVKDEGPADEAKPVETAALTPPTATVGDAEAASETNDEAAETAPGDTGDDSAAADENTKTPAAAGEDAAADEKPSAAEDDASAEAAPASEDAADTDTTAETAEPVAAEPPPPPAHPIVAAVRERLEDPDIAKQASKSDLDGLKAFYGERQDPPLWVTDAGFTPRAKAVMAEIGRADDWGLDAADFELPPTDDLLATPNAIADDELQLSLAVLKYARYAHAGQMRPTQASPLFDQHPSVRKPETVLAEIAKADAPDAYLTSLQPQQEQFKRLRTALREARGRAKATGQRPEDDPEVQLILINMERWRWMPRSLGTLHVWDNIPEFNTRVVKNGRVIYTERTIVGQVKYATPLFSAPMRNIVFHPPWTVPPTIVKEDLAPKLQGGDGGGFFGNSKKQILARYGLEVSLGGEPIDPDAVDWSNVNIHRYTFTQDPGPANVLGTLKFNFPNKHAIYMHDTIQPELFAERVRTLSHGCIRVQAPDRFAAVILGEDKGWSQAQVNNLLAQNETTVISLNRHIPVHLTYFTAVVDENGTVNSMGDVYGIDNRMAAKMFKRPAQFHVPSSPVVAETSSNAPQRGRTRGGGGLDQFISGLFGN